MIKLVNDSIPLSAMLAYIETEQAFQAVHMVRIMAADAGLDVSEAFRDREGRLIVDAIPDSDELDVAPITLRAAA